jgi:hypothetical protein
MKENEIIEQVESDLVDEICQKFEELGINTSEWEYRFGDGNTTSEFIKAGIAWHLEKLNTPVKEDWKEAFKNWYVPDYNPTGNGADRIISWIETNLINKP